MKRKYIVIRQEMTPGGVLAKRICSPMTKAEARDLCDRLNKEETSKSVKYYVSDLGSTRKTIKYL